MPDISPNDIPCWYAIHTRSNQEKIASEAIAGRGIECFLPSYEIVSHWKDRRRLLELPLFPGYLFARIPAAHKVKVAMVPSVVSVLCSRPVHDAVDEKHVACLQRHSVAKRVEPHAYLPVGRRVMIVRGLFAGLDGVLLQHRSTNTVVISLPSIIRAFSVEVNFEDVRDAASLGASTVTQDAL